MRNRKPVAALLGVILTLSITASKSNSFSDFTGVYARIDKVKFEPNDTSPERIQIWGAFSLASKTNRYEYDPPQRGYLYYSVTPGKEEVCRTEWADLKKIAGTDQIIGFGARNLARPRLRKADEKVADPDQYQVNFGLVKMSNRGSDYPPIRDLKALSKEP